MSELAWIDAALTAARPQAIGALLRYFRDLDVAEEAFQEASLRALQNWPKNGPPREPAAWLIFVGRNAALDGARRRRKQQALPADEVISDLDDAEAALAERLDGAHYRDDVLRLLFICCHPDLPATQQIALALRIVCGLSVKQIARAFLVGESATFSADFQFRHPLHQSRIANQGQERRRLRAHGAGGCESRVLQPHHSMKITNKRRSVGTMVQYRLEIVLLTVIFTFVGIEMAQGSQLPTGTARRESAPIAHPLRAHSSNHNYFANDSGKAVYLTGSHTWNDFQDWGTDGSPQPFNFAAYVKMLVAHHHNFTLLWQTELPTFRNLPTQATQSPDFTVTPQPWLRVGPGVASDGKPRFDLTQFNQAYFDRLRDRVRQLHAAGIYAGVYFLHPHLCGAHESRRDAATAGSVLNRSRAGEHRCRPL